MPGEAESRFVSAVLFQPWDQEPRVEAPTFCCISAGPHFLSPPRPASGVTLYLHGGLRPGSIWPPWFRGRLPSVTAWSGSWGAGGASHGLPIPLNHSLGFDPGSWLDRWEWTQSAGPAPAWTSSLSKAAEKIILNQLFLICHQNPHL